MKKKLTPSGFRELEGIEYFDFEEDFIEENVRCIPMTVRFKMDAAGIKLKLAEWSKFETSERIQLAVMPATTVDETNWYHQYLTGLIEKNTGGIPTEMPVDENPEWKSAQPIPAMLAEKAAEERIEITTQQWQALTDLQRFTLLKLCRPGHENKNFPKAVREFGLLK